MFKISKRFDFSASHQLEGLPKEHQCARLHGHNYTLTVHLEARILNNTGFVRDYGELDSIRQYIDTHLEHRHLNDIFDFNPTAENMAKFLFEVFQQTIPEIVAVSLKETDKTEAIYIA